MDGTKEEADRLRVEAELERDAWLDALTHAEKENERLRRRLKLLIEEITDVEGREGMSDADWIEQVVALAQAAREEFKRGG